VDDDQESPGQSNVDSAAAPGTLPLKDFGSIETPDPEIVAPEDPCLYRATHAFDDWREDEVRELLPSAPRVAGLVAGGFLVQVD